ncbi:hypothetical protein DPMN_032791 [Dreissena polymorpha]|uniref:Uncharacterized protein n=1 Tax=Dreissena polymorpha TaxID=45954 RepID=A0A9D4M5R6_DREPO|nr:hypothetical protein DPMN_032791 [Dreissena polymorpha]
MAMCKQHKIRIASEYLAEKCPAPGGHVFKPIKTIFELIQDIIGTNLLTKVLTKKKKRPQGGHVFQPTSIIFELVQDIIGMNLLTKKNAPPLGSHVFQANVTISKLIQNIIETNFLTTFHEDWTINVVSRELTRQMLMAHDGQKAITKAHHEPVVLRYRTSP